jgi:site-specific recombinase XerD
MTAAMLSTLVTDFFIVHLGKERNASQHTVMAYRDSLKMFLCFAARLRSHTIDRLELEDLSVEVVLEFLNYLEKDRGNTVHTRNLRLTAIHSFFRYTLSREPALASFCQRVLAIPFKKTTRRTLGYLSEEEMKSLLAQVDRTAVRGERDYVLIALLYDTGARVQELLDLKPSAFRLEKPAFVRVTGKGRKERLCPLLPQTARLVSNFLAEQRHEDRPCFLNRYGQQLSRHGVRYVLKKYLAVAQQEMPPLGRPGISPHSLRHTKAMHLLQAGIPPVTIKDILGHADIKSTEVYVETDLEMRRKALERVGTPSRAKKRGRPLARDLLKWLESL